MENKTSGKCLDRPPKPDSSSVNLGECQNLKLHDLVHENQDFSNSLFLSPACELSGNRRKVVRFDNSVE